MTNWEAYFGTPLLTSQTRVKMVNRRGGRLLLVTHRGREAARVPAARWLEWLESESALPERRPAVTGPVPMGM